MLLKPAQAHRQLFQRHLPQLSAAPSSSQLGYARRMSSNQAQAGQAGEGGASVQQMPVSDLQELLSNPVLVR